jgi:hypothetical protein
MLAPIFFTLVPAMQILDQAYTWPTASAFWAGRLYKEVPPQRRSTLRIGSETPPGNPADIQESREEDARRWVWLVTEVEGLFDQSGRPEFIVNRMENWSLYGGRGPQDNLTADLSVDAYLNANQTEEAFNLAVYRGNGESSDMASRQALCYAMRGAVFNGQIEFCRKQLSDDALGRDQYLPSGRTQVNAVVSAALACASTLGDHPGRALVFYRIADKADPNNPYLLYRMGIADDALGRGEEAQDLYRRALPTAKGRLHAALQRKLK